MSSSEKKETNLVPLNPSSTINKTEEELRDEVNNLSLESIDIPLLYEVMQIPSYSGYEFRMATFIMLWAKRNGISCEMDEKGNLYLTKGELEAGEYYPCMTSHMDTVQDKAKPYALAGAELPLKTRTIEKPALKKTIHEVYIDGQGIGADDKLGVYISLCIMNNFDKIKAVFFVEEEIGMLGSKELDKTFFNDVSYVIGWDSPDLLRSAWKCSGTRLFTYDFYVNHLKPIVSNWGFTDKCFHSEPYTDVVNIKDKTGVMCMNFGNGGYNAHASNEYLIVEDVNHAIAMGVDIVKTLGNRQRFVEDNNKNTASGAYNFYGCGEDNDKLSKLFSEFSYSNANYSFPASNTNKTEDVKKNTDGISEKAVKYIVDTYETYIENLKNDILSACSVENVTIAEIKEKVEEAFSKEIKF